MSLHLYGGYSHIVSPVFLPTVCVHRVGMDNVSILQRKKMKSQEEQSLLRELKRKLAILPSDSVVCALVNGPRNCLLLCQCLRRHPGLLCATNKWLTARKAGGDCFLFSPESPARWSFSVHRLGF